MESNDDVEARLIAELEAAQDTSGGAVLTEQQRIDIEKTSKECEMKLEEVKTLIRETMWANFVNAELPTAIQAAGAAYDLAAATQPDGNEEAYDFRLTHLQELVKTAKEVYSRWKRWVPPDEQQTFQSRVKELELCPKISLQKSRLHPREG